MTVTLTPDQLAALGPCDFEQRMALFGKRKRMNAKQALKAGATFSDLLWVAGRLGLKEQCVRFALACAQRVAHLNTDPRVQAALHATQAWLDNPTSENAAHAARAAAYAAAAARAADAAYADTAAAHAAAYNAADAAETEKQTAIFLEIFG